MCHHPLKNNNIHGSYFRCMYIVILGQVGKKYTQRLFWDQLNTAEPTRPSAATEQTPKAAEMI